ncbi:hypothetical protein BDGGKGIB_02298 [Nodularia sphaerocarpa UHCC 0038]|nr:hypothetical protein BDGGKGIB_02298 [Nodularia sphaerocarpa UHCC 0038]
MTSISGTLQPFFDIFNIINILEIKGRTKSLSL